MRHSGRNKAKTQGRSSSRLPWGTIILLLVLWYILADGNRQSWGVGIPVVIIAALLSSRIVPRSQPYTLRPVELLRFIGFFLWNSLKGGCDVAKRAFGPTLALQPAMIEYEFKLPPGPGRTLFINAISMMPGTFSAERVEGTLSIHTLDCSKPVAAEIEHLEIRIAKVLGLTIDNLKGNS